MIKKPTVKRLSKIDDLHIEEAGRAARLSLAFTDGSRLDIDILRADFRPLLHAVMATCAELGESAPEPRELRATTPPQAVLVPTEQMATTSHPDGGLWLMFRVGAVDIAVALPDPRSAELLADALLHPPS